MPYGAGRSSVAGRTPDVSYPDSRDMRPRGTGVSIRRAPPLTVRPLAGRARFWFVSQTTYCPCATCFGRARSSRARGQRPPRARWAAGASLGPSAACAASNEEFASSAVDRERTAGPSTRRRISAQVALHPDGDLGSVISAGQGWLEGVSAVPPSNHPVAHAGLRSGLPGATFRLQPCLRNQFFRQVRKRTSSFA